jgi:hypothetical protein
VTKIELLLFAGFGSSVSDVTLAVLVIVVFPRTITVTWIVAVAVVSCSTVPAFQVTTPV